MNNKMQPQTLGSWSISTELPVEFTIENSPGIFSIGNESILSFGSRGDEARRLIVIDRNICQYYLHDIISYFKHYEVECHIVHIDATENEKELKNLVYLLTEIEEFGVLRRNEPIIAVGGGVLLDIAGMASCLYRRGIPYIRIPTTLVGLIDASVGAKTGINFHERRNRLGSYYPPLASYLDKRFLKTLEPIEISSGLGEILKMGVIKDYKLFELLEEYGNTLLDSKFLDCECSDEVINRSVQGMKEELENNLWEKNLKRSVDFGHSFSPIIEMRSIQQNEYPSLTHGQAVTIDVIFSSVIAMSRNLLSEHDTMRVIRTAKSMALPTIHPLFEDPLSILEALQDTMKHRNGDQNLPVPSSIGECVFINDLSYDEIKQSVLIFQNINDELKKEG
jgi:2-epi-5-epi-valiolone synthase